MAPHLVDGQVVLLPPGTFGSYVMARQVAESGSRADVAWAETGTLPYLARKHGEREVNVTIRAIRLPTGVYPARKEAQAIEVIRRAYPAVHGCGDALSGALMNAGPVIHPPLMVMNAAPLQHFERWDIHNEGTQRGGARRHRPARPRAHRGARRRSGEGAPHYPLADHYNNDQWMYGDALMPTGEVGRLAREHRPPHAPLHRGGHRARAWPSLASTARFVGRRCADRPRAAGDRRRLPRARSAQGPRTL